MLVDGELCAAAAGREGWCMVAKREPWKKESILWIGGGVCSTVRAGGKESWSFGHTRAVYTAKARGYVFHSLGTRVCPVVGSLRKAGMERVVW